MKKITLLFTALLLTAISWQSSAQLSEDFEAGMTSLTNATTPANGVDFALETVLFHGGTQSVKNAYASSNTNILEQVAVMDLSATTNPQLDFWHIAKTEGTYDKCYVEISTDGGANYTALTAAEYQGAAGDFATRGYFHEDSYTQWGTGTTPAADNTWWKKETFSLAAYKTSSTVKIRFNLTSDSSVNREGWYIDDVTVTDPSCLAPSALTASAITATSADLAWTAGGSETMWNIEVVDITAGGTVTGTATDTGVTNPFTKNGLVASNSYEYYVQADCGGGNGISTWVGPFAFNTACGTFVAPYTQDFENGGIIPICWSMSGAENWNFSNSATGNHIGNNGTITGATNSGGYFAWVDSSGSEADAVLLSPLVDVSGLTTPALSFFEISDNEGNANSQLLVEVWDGAGWNTMGTYTANTIGWEQKTLDLSGLTITGDVQARFTFTEPTSGDFYDDIAIDDVSFDEMPLCINPSALAAAPSSTTDVDLSWSAGGSETNWTYEYGLTGYTQGDAAAILGSAAVATTPAVSLMGLTAGTSYDYYVQSNCGGGNSAWIGPFTWTQPNIGDTCALPIMATVEVDCSTATPITIDFTTATDIGSAGTCDTGTGNIGAWIQFTAPTSGALKLTNSGVDNEIVIYDACGGNEVYCSTLGPDLNLSGLTPNAVYYMAIWKDSFNTMTSDNFCLEEVTCLFPTALAATTTDVTADLSWTTGASETMWNYEYGLSGYTQGDAAAILGSGPVTPSPAVALSGLTGATSYDYYVQADCGGGSTSAWSGPFTFITEVTPIVPDYLNDFATYPGAGWLEAAGPYGTPNGTSSAWGIDDFGNDAAHANGKCAKVNLYNASQDEYLISPPFDLSGGTYYLNVDIAFTEWGNTNPGVWDADDYVALLVTQDGTTWTELTRWDSTTAVGTTRQAANEITLTGYNANTKFAFYGSSTVDNANGDATGPDNDFFVDNFQITASALSIADNVIEGFSIYPNPVNDVLKLSALDTIDTISIYNLLGQEVLVARPNALQTELNMTDLTVGVYVVKVKVGNQLGTYKIVKK